MFPVDVYCMYKIFQSCYYYLIAVSLARFWPFVALYAFKPPCLFYLVEYMYNVVSIV